MRAYLLLGLLAGWLVGCGGPAAQVERSYETGCWPMTDTLRWTAEAAAGTLPLDIELKLGTDFRTQNLFLKLRYRREGGAYQEMRIEDTLMNPQGEWLQPISGNTVDWKVDPRPQLNLPQAGTYQFELFHFMRDTLLCAVQEVRVYSDH